jgi:hypothetical protein
MKFFEILTQYDLQLEDGSYVDSSDTIFVTEDEYSDDLLKEVTESTYDEGMKVRSVSVKEVTPEEVTEYYKNRIINQIIPSIYREGLNLPKDISIREYARLSSGPIHQALALKKFDEYLHENKYNPGTTADFTAASIFVSLIDKYSQSGL